MASATRVSSQWRHLSSQWSKSWFQRSTASSANAAAQQMFTPDTLNENVKTTQYAVRGEIYLEAEKLRREGVEITFTNVGNPHALGQKPLTFPRQVIALCSAPFLIDHPKATEMFPKDAIARAKEILEKIKGGVGAYTDSRGSLGLRQEVADFIEKRDGYPSHPDSIFLTDGASVAVRTVMQAILRDRRDGVLVPIPQYPLYSASVELYNGTLCPYFLDEKKNWGMNIADLQRAVDEARGKGVTVRGMVFINPGNPTGQCLSLDNLKDLARFAYDNRIVLMADEVYQENVYQDERPFVSMKKTINDMGEPYASGQELMSFHTVSKGSPGECGLRGGYVEMTNIHPGIVDELYKMVSINLSPNVIGQVALACMVNPPKPGDESYEQYVGERQEIIQSLRRRAHMMTDAFNSLEGFSCEFTEGAMYSFPQIVFPQKFVDEAASLGKSPDGLYCLYLVRETGISTVPGSGFGQEPGTYHLRTTILPSEEAMPSIIAKFKSFHEKFMDKYR